MSAAEKEQHRCQVVGISGSIRPGSYTTMAVALALKGAEEFKCETKLINLRDYDLLFCDGKEDESKYPKDVFRLREDVRQAHGIILGTPEYHGGYSGVLKNALDLMGFEEFEGKMLGLVGVSGGAVGAFGAMNSLREVGRALHAWVIPEQASIPQVWQEFDEAGNLKDAELDKRVRAVGRQVARFAYLHGARRMNSWRSGRKPAKTPAVKSLGGGANVAQQYLKAGLIDEMEIHVVPILLGDGARLFDNTDGQQTDYECIGVVNSPAVSHYKYRRRQPHGTD